MNWISYSRQTLLGKFLYLSSLGRGWRALYSYPCEAPNSFLGKVVGKLCNLLVEFRDGMCSFELQAIISNFQNNTRHKAVDAFT